MSSTIAEVLRLDEPTGCSCRRGRAAMYIRSSPEALAATASTAVRALARRASRPSASRRLSAARMEPGDRRVGI